MRFALAAVFAALLLAPSASARPVDLQTDAATRLLGTDEPHPRLEWRLSRGDQTAYRVRVTDGARVLWDSGRVKSGEQFATYAGRALPPRRRITWTVTVWDERRRATTSTPTWFETALDTWQAKWIAGAERVPTEGLAGLVDDAEMQARNEFCRPVGVPGPLTLLAGPQRDEYLARREGSCRAVRPAPLLRKEFGVEQQVERARLYVSGMGYADVHLNGEQLGDGAVLDPGYTDYAKTALYKTYDVTDRVKAGSNALGVELGSGFYDYDVISEWSWTKADWRADPRVRAELHLDLADGTTRVVATDESWRTAAGPTRYDNINIGETYDARFAAAGWNRPGFDDASWSAARPVEAPKGTPTAQVHEPIAVVARREPVAVREPRPGVKVYDLGEQLTGWVELEIEAPAGQAAQIVYAEDVLPDGSADTHHNLHIADRLQTDFLVAGDGPVRWRPRFSYKGFRYIQVSGPRDTPFTGTVKDVEVQVVRSAVERTGDFDSGSRLVDGVFGLVERAIPNNLHGIVTDTPVYEKNGWTGDAQLTAPTAATLFDMRRFYRKWLRDIRDSQIGTGEIPVIVPSSEQYGYTDVGWDAAWGPTPAWDAALFVIPWEVYERYGDDRLLRESYTTMRRYLDDHLTPAASGHIVDSALGDHLSPSSTDGIGLVGSAGVTKIVSTGYYAEFVRRTAELAGMLGDTETRDRYRALWPQIRDAFNAAFFDAERNVYREDPEDDEVLQTAQVVPLAFGLVPRERRDEVAETIVADVEASGGNLDTGVVGTRYLLEELTAAGHLDTAYGIVTQRDKPSWGEWIDLGYTSLPENWGPTIRSLDHHMFGSVGQWLFEDLAGVEPLKPGYEEIEIKPEIPSRGLDSASMSLDTVRGRVSSAWRRTESGVVLDVTVPPGSRAVLRLGDVVRRVGPGTHRVRG